MTDVTDPSYAAAIAADAAIPACQGARSNPEAQDPMLPAVHLHRPIRAAFNQLPEAPSQARAN